MVKEKKKSLTKNSHGTGFKRTQKQWESSAATHIGKFLDRMTTSDILNLVVFGAGAYATYKGIEAAEEVTEIIPDWLKWLSPLSPFLYQLVIPTEIAARMSETDKIVASIIGGYSLVKLAPLVVQTIGQAAIPTS
jgi:uncharacterized protein involved in cysteine biosynthesis